MAGTGVAQRHAAALVPPTKANRQFEAETKVTVCVFGEFVLSRRDSRRSVRSACHVRGLCRKAQDFVPPPASVLKTRPGERSAINCTSHKYHQMLHASFPTAYCHEVSMLSPLVSSCFGIALEMSLNDLRGTRVTVRISRRSTPTIDVFFNKLCSGHDDQHSGFSCSKAVRSKNVDATILFAGHGQLFRSLRQPTQWLRQVLLVGGVWFMHEPQKNSSMRHISEESWSVCRRHGSIVDEQRNARKGGPSSRFSSGAEAATRPGNTERM